MEVSIQRDPETGDAYVELPPSFLALEDWREGDRLNWEIYPERVGAVISNLSLQDRLNQVQ